MEKLGVAAAVVTTEPFVSSGKAMAVAHGIPDYPFAVIAHPIAATEAPTLHGWADGVVDQLVSIWQKGETAGR